MRPPLPRKQELGGNRNAVSSKMKPPRDEYLIRERKALQKMSRTRRRHAGLAKRIAGVISQGRTKVRNAGLKGPRKTLRKVSRTKVRRAGQVDQAKALQETLRVRTVKITRLYK